ncbi:putative outer membrane protein [Nostoc phage A1]|nr:putative outer membrane protein [Nostoc phage A1]
MPELITGGNAMSDNKEGLTDDQSNDQQDAPENSGSDIDAKLEAKFKAFEDKINQALNGVVKKVEKRFSTEKPPESKKGTDSSESDSKKPELDTIQALKAEMEKSRKELEEQLEAERQERAKDKRQVFLSSVESKISTAIAGQKFDDPEAALTVFKSMYGLDNWHPGTSGYVIYKTSEEDEGKTLESLVKDWAKSPVGKRFFNKNLPNGTGLDTPDNARQTSDKAKTLFEKRKQAKESGFKIKM